VIKIVIVNVNTTNYIILSLILYYRSVCRQKWKCQHSTRNKSFAEDRSKSTDCKAFVDIKIKKISYSTKRKDSFLRLDPPLAAIIKLNLQHNHNQTSADALKFLKPTHDVKEIFEDYFNQGMLVEIDNSDKIESNQSQSNVLRSLSIIISVIYRFRSFRSNKVTRG